MARQPFQTRRSIPASRLKPPLLPRSFVSRKELLACASEVLHVAVVAPGGYGKTCLLAELFASADRSAWYTVREEDSDPGSLAFGIATAFAAGGSERGTEEVQ